VLFLTCAEERVAAATKDGVRVGDRVLRPAPRLQARNLTGRFGVLRYYRTYLRENHDGRRRGLHPLDLVLGLPADRFSMRWIRERAAALLQLRCIEINGHWDAFVTSVDNQLMAEGGATGLRQRL
jgi:hypothetical protein